MGHVRVGRLPKRFGWQHVVGSLYAAAGTPGADSDDQIFAAASAAAGKALGQSRQQDSLAHAYWYLLKLALASRSEDFRSEVLELGIQVPAGGSGFALLGAVMDNLRQDMRRRGWVTPVDQIALQSFQTAISEIVAEESQSLFGSTVETAQQAIRHYSTKQNVAGLGRRFFSEFAFRILSRALERELASSVAAGGRFEHEGQLSNFRDRLKSYCWDISKLVEDFAGGWYSKHAWMEDITEEQTKKFTAYAVEKLLSEAAPSPARA
jgi:hypothetical protein